MKEVKEIVAGYSIERDKEVAELKELAEDIKAIRDTVKDARKVHIPLYIEPERINAAADQIKAFFGTVPEKAILCCSSMARFILKHAKLEKVVEITTELEPNQRLPYFYLAELNREKVVIVDELQICEDKYPEFYPILPLRALVLSGVKQSFIVSEAFSTDPLAKPGDTFLFENYMPMNIVNPFIGRHIKDWGKRFLDVSVIFDPEKNDIVINAMKGTLSMTTKNIIWVDAKKTYGDKAEILMAQRLKIPVISNKGMIPSLLFHDMDKDFVSIGVIERNLNCNTSINNQMRKEIAEKLIKVFALDLKIAKTQPSS